MISNHDDDDDDNDTMNDDADDVSRPKIKNNSGFCPSIHQWIPSCLNNVLCSQNKDFPYKIYLSYNNLRLVLDIDIVLIYFQSNS